MQNRHFFSMLMLVFPFEAHAFFCPNNFNQIDFGNTVDQVTTQCGKPDKIVTKEVQNEGPQEWNYYVTQTVDMTAFQQAQGTLKTQVTFDASGKAVNISVNGIGVGASSVCGNTPIQLGDTREMVKAACGDPSFINKQSPDVNSPLGSQPPAMKVTELTYNASPSPVTLVFENGLLTKQQ